MPPHLIPYVMEKLFKAGVVDVWLTPIVMKKGRLATKISALIENAKKNEAAAIILSETSSIGLRISSISRIVAERKVVKVKTEYGQIAVKLAYHEGRLVNVAPEYEDCTAIAEKKKIPLKIVYQEAMRKASTDFQLE